MWPTTETCWVYALVDPRTMEFCYVGCTGKPEQRIEGHWAQRREGWAGSLKNQWLCDLESDGRRPLMMLLEEVSSNKAREAEAAWIVSFLYEGEPVTNRIHWIKGAYSDRWDRRAARLAASR